MKKWSIKDIIIVGVFLILLVIYVVLGVCEDGFNIDTVSQKNNPLHNCVCRRNRCGVFI